MEATPPTRARRPLVEALEDPSYTPRRDDLPALIEMLAAAEQEQARVIERAILRIGEAAAPGLVARLREARPPLRARLMRALGRLFSAPVAVEAAVEALTDSDPKTRRSAAIALGKALSLEDPRVAPGLLAAAEVASDGADLRPLVEALGKRGDAAALAWLEGLDPGQDHELARLRGRAILTLGRTLAREDAASEVLGEVMPAGAVWAALTCRPGLETLLQDELEEARALAEPEIVGAGRVEGRLLRPLGELLRGARTALEISLLLPPTRGPVVPAVVDSLSAPATRRLLTSLTRGPLRYRLAWQDGGHRRAETWAIAAGVRERAPELRNDPTASTWEVRIGQGSGEVRLELVPRRLVDPRFSYRCGDIPAASHPTVAAALVRLAGVREGDVVWDPFVGSGLELCERARLGRYERLIGSDRDAATLEIARNNLVAVGAERFEVLVADALTHEVAGGVTCILTNPPLGRRLHRDRIDALLCAFLGRAAKALRPGGRLVWITPQPRETGIAARSAGLSLERHLAVDLGGLHGVVEVWRRP
jgi:23S rRNA G2445 N2-methylase RlmL